jgi:hypothetical protein
MQAAPKQREQHHNNEAGWRDPHATVFRLFTSQHVKDLQIVIFGAVVLLLIAGVIAWAHGKFWTFIAPGLAVFGAIVSWAYQLGSARLGVVDLFACEISTLCRVATVVRTTHRFIENFLQGPPSPKSRIAAAGHFASEENYFPIFDSNNRDLQALEASVVINITAFYTYMKAVRDSLRALAEVKPDSVDLDSPSKKGDAAGRWHNASRNVVYMLFLGLESARHAVSDLVEFEPEKAERTIVILLSELEAWGFLRTQFDEEDIFYKRIMLRAPEYQQLVLDLCSAVGCGLKLGKQSKEASFWEEAKVLLPELNDRYCEAMRDLRQTTVEFTLAGAAAAS